MQESPAVAEAFLGLRKAEEQDAAMQRRLAAQKVEIKRAASKAIADRDAAIADLNGVKKHGGNRRAWRVQVRHQNIHLGTTGGRQP